MRKATLGERLFNLRDEAGLTQKQLAEKAGISHVSVVSIETGKVTNPRMPTIRRLAKAFSLTPEEFLGEVPQGKGREILDRYERSFAALEREVERVEDGEAPRDGVGGLYRRINAEAIAAENIWAQAQPDAAVRILSHAANLIDRLAEVIRKEEEEMEKASERLREKLPAA